MDLASILAKLETAKEILTVAAPDGLDELADVTERVTAALRDAAAYLRQFRGSAAVGGVPDLAPRAAALRAECEGVAAPPLAAVAGLPPGLKQLLAAIIVQLLDRLFPSA